MKVRIKRKSPIMNIIYVLGGKTNSNRNLFSHWKYPRTNKSSSNINNFADLQLRVRVTVTFILMPSVSTEAGLARLYCIVTVKINVVCSVSSSTKVNYVEAWWGTSLVKLLNSVETSSVHHFLCLSCHLSIRVLRFLLSKNQFTLP